MARLEDLRPLFHRMDEDTQRIFVRNYRDARAIDLDRRPAIKEKKAKQKLSPEQKALLKKLGLTATSVKNLSD